MRIFKIPENDNFILKILTLDSKIMAAQDKVVKAKARYEKAVRTLEALMEKREELRRKELMEAVRKNDHTYEEILCFIRG